jgi:hypothetical protein
MCGQSDLKQANAQLGHSAGDELAVLMTDIAPTELARATLRIRDALAADGIAATFGYDWREATRTLPQVQEAVDAVLIRARLLRPKRPRYAATAQATVGD